uniref:Uncharacterized protein n=1 Tax=Candidatus Kentrum sp. FW TaxID=2126338 RepID=A0A450T6H0_9GAMM|nr:MAG: hypothetical protein BECKFW1821A_GA0114235_101739 [Candidatus Kentron sp. FW]VFJ62395.1 MAG: hypothetical protein BECKFW1821B_GA0114236_107315 [Candidatus Kentron sp. FW]
MADAVCCRNSRLSGLHRIEQEESTRQDRKCLTVQNHIRMQNVFFAPLSASKMCSNACLCHLSFAFTRIPNLIFTFAGRYNPVFRMRFLIANLY